MVIEFGMFKRASFLSFLVPNSIRINNLAKNGKKMAKNLDEIARL